MPNYNTSTPTPTSKNTINSVTVGYGIRDFLLNLNLLPQYPQISTSLNGSPKIGEPVLNTTVGTGNVVIPIGLPLETNGILFKDLNLIYNTFQNTQSNSNDLTEINNINAIPNSEWPNSYWPQGIQSYPTSANDEVEQYGLVGKTNEGQFRRDNTIKNLYLDATKQIDVADLINLQPNNITQQISGYMDAYGELNLGGSGGVQAANVIGSIISGQGLGFSKSGVVPNFDIRSSLAGRVLGATGIIKDTKLGNIGGQQLALALANNAAFNVQQELLGSLNVKDNILSLIKGRSTDFRPSYKITIPKGPTGRVLDTAGKILGFTIPRSYLDDEGSLFQSENKGAENIVRANSMILNTGKGQVKALIENINTNLNGTNGIDGADNSPFRTGYAPAYRDNKGNVKISNGNLYAFSQSGHTINLFGTAKDSVIANLSYNREELVSNSGFKTPEQTLTGTYGQISNSGYDNRKLSNVGFTWTTNKGEALNNISDKSELSTTKKDMKSLLNKTQKLFNDVGMRNIVTKKGDMNKKSSQIQTANGKGFSKGNAVLKRALFDDNGRYKGEENLSAEDTYCRSWTTLHRYDRVSRLVRNDALFDKPGIPIRHKMFNSVLDDNGFPKISPYINDLTSTDPKKFMFSIENLAWADDYGDLPKCEQGTGDLVSGKKGRIMWFPPYNINFSENSSVSWESNNFIGRGEPLYTYNNTERSGNLSFQVIVDHPSYANAFAGSNGPDDNYINSFWAGCIDPESKIGENLTVSQRSFILEKDYESSKPITLPKEPPLKGLRVYYPNDNSDYNPKYENGLSGSSINDLIDYDVLPDGKGYGLSEGSIADTTQKQIGGVTLRWVDRFNYGYNYSKNSSFTKTVDVGDLGIIKGFSDPTRTEKLGRFLTEKCKHCVVTIQGFASKQGLPGANEKLSKLRGDKIKKYLIDELRPYYEKIGLTESQINDRFKVLKGEEVTTDTGCVKQSAGYKDPPTDSKECKGDRYVSIEASFSEDLFYKENGKVTPRITKKGANVTSKITNKFYNECSYFEKLIKGDENVPSSPFVFDTFREKIKYFHPAFHSTTPEGLNSRLTFLLQCTRQGKTLEEQGANNLAFGRPPVCILRIGDFYNTKIVIDSVSFDFEPLVWDLNPEGIGVQPMIANVTMSFKFIGGSTLMGPINKLQNALSFNYFANTQVYDPRADYFEVSKKSKTGYDVINGVKSMSGMSTYELILPFEKPEIDQEMDADLSLLGNNELKDISDSGTTATTATTATTSTLNELQLNNIKFDGALRKYDNLINGYFTLTFNVINLKKDFDFRVTLFDSTNKPFEIGVGKLLKDKIGEQVFLLTINKNTFKFRDSIKTPGQKFTKDNYILKVDIIDKVIINREVTLSVIT
jgi:hypothetical protein